MADYSSVYGVADKLTNTTTLETGHREPPLESGTWQTEPIPGDTLGDTTGRHYALAPIAEDYRIHMPSFFRRVQWHLSHMKWFADGSAHDPSYQIGGGASNNFGSWWQYPITAASGNTLTLSCNGANPFYSQTYFTNTRDDPNDPFTTTTYGGLGVQVGDCLNFIGNSVAIATGATINPTSRLKCRILAVDFSGCSNPPGEDDTFTVTVNQDVSSVLTPKDPDGTIGVDAIISREAYAPEAWMMPIDNHPAYYVEREVTLTSWSSDGTIVLTDPLGNNAECAFPYQNIPGWRDTYKIEKSSDGGTTWMDITSSVVAGDRWINNFFGGEYYTVLFLGTLDKNAEPQASLIAGANRLRLRYCYRVANSGVTDSFSPQQDRCAYDMEDYSGTIETIPGEGLGKRGCHYCSRKDELPDGPIDLKANYEASTNGCLQLGRCPYFTLRNPNWQTAYSWQQVWNSLSEAVYQLAVGSSNNGSFARVRLGVPSIMYLLNPPDAFKSPDGYHPMIMYPGTGKFEKYSTTSTVDGNQSVITKKGAFHDYNASLDGLEFPNNAAAGLLPSNVDAPGSNTLLSAEAYKSRWVGARSHGAVFRDCTSPGLDIVFSARNVPSVEGENRSQRVDRTYVRTLIVDPANTTTNQSDPLGNYVRLYDSAREVDGISGVKGIVQLLADGVQDYGTKRIGGNGLNGQIWNIELVSGNVYRIHCAPGLWSSDVDGIGTSVIKSFYGGGNVVRLDYPWEYNRSYSNSANNRYCGTMQTGAVAGDTINIDGHRFLIKDAKPCNGDDFSGSTTLYPAVGGTIGAFFNTGADGFVEIADFYHNFYGTLTKHYGAGSPAIKRMLYTERPIGISDDYTDLANVYLQFDQVEVSEGVWSGSQQGYFSLGAYYWAWLTTAGYVFYVEWTVDGGSLQGGAVLLETPHIHLSLGSPDTSKINEWTVTLNDSRLDGGEATLTYGGVVTGLKDTTLLTANPYNWFWCAAENAVVFHPSLAGAYARVDYVSLTGVSLGDEPIGHAYWPVDDTSHRTHCDTLDVVDEGGWIAANAEAGMQFTVNTAGIICPPELGGRTAYLSFAPLDEGTYSVITPSAVNYARGRYYLSADNVSDITEAGKLNAIGDIFNRTNEVTAEHCKAIVDALGQMDTMRAYATSYQLLDAICGGEFYIGLQHLDEAIDEGNTFIIGVPNGSLPLTQDLNMTINGLIQDSERNPGDIMEDFFYTQEPWESSGGAPVRFTAGSVDFSPTEGGIVQLNGLLWEFNWEDMLGQYDILAKLDSGATIEQAWGHLTMPSDASVIRRVTNRRVIVNPGFGYTYNTIAEMPDEDEILGDGDSFSMQISLVVVDNDGNYSGYGSIDVGEMTIGKTKVFNATELVEKIIAFKKSPYVKLYLYPSSISIGGYTQEPIPVGGGNARAVIPQLIKNYFSFEFTRENDTTGIISATDVSMTVGTGLAITGLVVQFSLPSSSIDKCLPYGNLPSFSL